MHINYITCLLVVFLLIGFSVINFNLGTNEIQRIWNSSSFVCNQKLPSPTDVCDKKYGFSLGSALEFSFLLAFLIGVVSKNRKQANWLPISVVVSWEVLMEIFSRVFSIPMLYSWENSSLHFGFLTVFPTWVLINASPVIVFSVVLIIFGLAGFGIKKLILAINKLILL